MCRSFYQNITPSTPPCSNASDKPENQQIENLMCENKLLRDELAKSKEAIEILKATKTDGCLSEKQCKQLEQEMTVVRQLYSIDLDNFAEPCEDNNVIMPSFFDQLTNDVKLKCPLLTNIVNSLAVGKSTEKNVGKKDCDFKFKAAIQTVMALDDIRSERSKSSFSTIFGLLLIAHGAGKAMFECIGAIWSLQIIQLLVSVPLLQNVLLVGGGLGVCQCSYMFFYFW